MLPLAILTSHSSWSPAQTKRVVLLTHAQAPEPARKKTRPGDPWNGTR